MAMRIINKIRAVTANCLADLKSAHDIKRQLHLRRQNKHVAPIKVEFIAQMPEVWDKQMDLFACMLHDDRFDPGIIYVNHFDFINKGISSTKSDEKQFYIDLYGEDLVTDIDELSEEEISRFDYVFYDRPYNQYLPDVLKSWHVVKKTRICLINYCTCDWDGPLGYRDFARNVYMWFATSTVEKEQHDREYGRKPYNRVFNVGYPILDRYSKMRPSKRTDRILWTPRWSYDPNVGGSHFLEYIHHFIQFKSDNPDITLTIRPHPLMFDNLIAENRLTHEEVLRIKCECQKSGIAFDDNRNIEATLRETDILISDYSSILRLYLVTGRPIIYCPCDIPINEEFSQLVNAMYVAEQWKDISDVLNRLFNGDDNLRDQRTACVNKQLNENKDSAETILNILYEDYHEK